MAHHCHNQDKANLSRRLKWWLAVLFGILLISFYPHPLIEPLNNSLVSYISSIWWAVLLGLIIGAVIDQIVPTEFIVDILGKGKVSSLFYAVIAGFLLSACSHGILAIAMQLHKKGASTPATVTFLLATPWANLPVTILLFSFFGTLALWIIAGAMLIAIVTGFLFLLLERFALIERHAALAINDSYTWQDIKKFKKLHNLKLFGDSFINLSNMVLWWIIIGVLVAAIIGAYVPHHIFNNYFDSSFSGLLFTLFGATIIEVCSEGSSPIAFEIYNQVGALGNPFVFLMAGVVTDYTEIGLIWSNIGKKTAIWLPLVTVPQVIFLAVMFNAYL